jgi:hypothetical protein
MKKLLIFMLVLGMASAANAALTWSVSAITIDIDETVTVNLVADHATQYGAWMGASTPTIADITAVSILTAAGGESKYTEDYKGYTGWWYLEAIDISEPFELTSGAQWDVTFIGQSTGVQSFVADDYQAAGGTVDDMIDVTVVPEPTTIALLGLGGLFLLRRRK